MALDWDNIIIETDEYSYSLDAEQRMILFAGNKGDKGDAATIQIGTVTTLPARSQATVQNVGTEEDAVFNFGIPQGEKGDIGEAAWGDITGTLSNQTDLQNALNAKQDTLSWDTAPTSGGTNPMRSGAIYAHEPFQVTGTASAGSSVTFTDSRINSDHWKVPKNGIYFGTPSNVTSGVHWVTNSTSHTITLQATFSGSTTVEIDMNWYQ